MKRRAISFLTVLALCLSLCPVRVLAADDANAKPSAIYNVNSDYTGSGTYTVGLPMQFDTHGNHYTISDQTAIRVSGTGKLYLTTGTIESQKGAGIEVQSGCFLCVDQSGMTVIGTTYGLDIASGATAQLSGGTFKGTQRAINLQETGGDYGALLASGYAYFKESGEPIPLTDVGRETAVVVKRCTDHAYDYTANGGVPTHKGVCKYCGDTVASEECTFRFDENGRAGCEHCDHTVEITIAVNADDLIYDGTSKPAGDPDPVTAVLDGTTTLNNDVDYTVEYKTGTNAGEIAAVTVTGITYSGTFTKTFSVTQALPVITWDTDTKPVPISVDYDGDSIEAAELPPVIITAHDADDLKQFLYYSYRKAGDTDYTAGLPTDAGIYEITASLPEQTNYKAASSAPITLTINKINPIKAGGAPKANTLTYNGDAQDLVTRGTVWDGAAVLFATNENGPWSTAIPTGTNAGTYEVWYMVAETANYIEVTATKIENTEIRRKAITPDVTLEYTSHVYTDGALQPTVTVRDPDTWAVLPTSEYSVAYSDNTNVGTATVTVTNKDGGNYDITTVKVKFDITPKDQDGLTITKTPNSVSYGDVFTLEATGGSGNGTITWAIIDGGEYAEINAGGQVTVKGVGTVTVRATRTGDDYKDATAEWEFTAGPKHVTAIVTADNKVYDGNNTAAVTAVVEQSDLVLPGDVITITGPSGTFSDANAGTGKTVTVTGTASITGTGSEKYIVTIPKTTTADITKATITVTAPTENNRTYDGTEKPLINAGKAYLANNTSFEVPLEYALSAGDPYSTYIPQATDAGSYEVWYRVQGTDNYFGTTAARISVTISPKTVSNPSITLSQNSYTYDGTEKKPAVTVKESTGATDVIPSSEYTVAYSSNVNVGTATVTITDNPGGNYTVSGSTTFTINKANAVLTVAPQAIAGLTYNGQAQYLMSAGTATGGSLMYSLTETGTYTDTIPKETNAGEYKVYYKVVGDDNHTDIAPAYVYVTIQPKTVVSPNIELSLTETAKYTGKYNGSPQEPTVTSVKDGTDTIPSTEYDVTYSDNVNAGTATVRIVDRNGGNYTVNGSKTFEITKATARFTTDPQASSVTYNGKAQTLIKAGIPDGGTAVYSPDGENGPYSEALPTGTDRGEYTVWAKVQGDSNHVDSAPISIANVKIDPKSVTPTVTCSPSTFPYDGTEKTPNIIVTDSSGERIPDSEYTVELPSNRVAVGPYTVTVKARTGGNYDFTAVTKQFEIVEADQAPLSIVTDMAPTVCYGDTFRLSAVGGSGTGAVKWSIKEPDTGVATVDPDTGVVKVIGVGEFTVTAYREGNGGYGESNTDSMTFAAKAKPVTPVITVTDKGYDGTKTATLTAAWKSGDMVGDDDITITVTGEFVTADAGTGKQVKIIGTPTATPKAETDTNVSNYDITYPDTVTGSIYRVDAELTTVPAAITGLSYTGGELALITGGATKDDIGTVEYSLSEKGAYSIAIPTGKNVGTYTVWYRVAESVNWTGIGPVSVEVTIGKARPEITEYPTSGSIYPNQPLSKSELTGGKATCNGTVIPGSFAWKDGETKYEAGKQYEVVFTPDDTTNYESVSIFIEPGVDSGSTDPTPEPEPEPEPETPGAGGSTTTPPTTQSGTESPSTQTTVRDGTASTVLNSAAGNKLADEAVANQSENVVIKPEITGDVTKTEVSIPASAVRRIGNETDASLTVSTPIADVTIPNGALGALSDAGGTVSVAAEQVDNTVVLTLTANGRAVEDLPGGLTLTVPAEDAGPGTVAVLVYEDGTREVIRKSVAGDDGVRIPLNGSATVEIVDNSKEFADVSPENWAADAVAFASAHEMFIGTSETTFSPELSMSRAMLATVLYNLESNPDTAFSDAFADIDGDAWYAESVSWAANCGIVTGYDNGSFGANDSITREQLAVMLWRYAGSPAADEQTLDFTDADQTSGYAVEAMRWAAANGILNGYGDGRIDPTGPATRAQAAQMLKNFIENT